MVKVIPETRHFHLIMYLRSYCIDESVYSRFILHKT